jgi:hypothetical protein
MHLATRQARRQPKVGDLDVPLALGVITATAAATAAAARRLPRAYALEQQVLRLDVTMDDEVHACSGSISGSDSGPVVSSQWEGEVGVGVGKAGADRADGAGPSRPGRRAARPEAQAAGPAA